MMEEKQIPLQTLIATNRRRPMTGFFEPDNLQAAVVASCHLRAMTVFAEPKDQRSVPYQPGATPRGIGQTKS